MRANYIVQGHDPGYRAEASRYVRRVGGEDRAAPGVNLRFSRRARQHLVVQHAFVDSMLPP